MLWDISQTDSSVEWKFNYPIRLVWTDPPFGTGKTQRQTNFSFVDPLQDEAIDITIRAIENIYQFLTPDATVCILADYRIIHDIIYELKRDKLYFQGEVIWEFGLGRPRTSWWPNRHNTIATFTKSPSGLFDPDAIPRSKRLAPKAGYPEDKPSGSVWEKTLSNTDPERVGYPNQKPLDIIKPFILAHTKPGDWVADPFMGSASVGEAALRLGRNFIGQDLSEDATAVTEQRLSPY